MRRLDFTDPALALAALRQKFKRSPESRLEHRLHCVLLVAAGQSCSDVATVFDDDPRTIQRWVRRFGLQGVEGLHEMTRPGRPATLSAAQMLDLEHVLGSAPHALGYMAETWRSDLLRAEVTRRFGVVLSRRQCQRLLAILKPPESPDAG